MTELKLSHVGHILRRQGSLGKTANKRWTDTIKEAIGRSLQEPSRAAEDRTLWTLLRHRVTRSHVRAPIELWFGGRVLELLDDLTVGLLCPQSQMSRFLPSSFLVLFHITPFRCVLHPQHGCSSSQLD